MSVTSRLAARGRTRTSAWGRRRSLAGMAYALPTLVFVLVFFILPLLLVGQMSASDWKLLVGDKGINFPTNYGALNSSPLFWPAIACAYPRSPKNPGLLKSCRAFRSDEIAFSCMSACR